MHAYTLQSALASPDDMAAVFDEPVWHDGVYSLVLIAPLQQWSACLRMQRAILMLSCTSIV